MRGVLPQNEACRTLEGMGEATGVRREQIAKLRRAVIAAHPDHGGTAESLQVALAALRAASNRAAEPRESPAPPSAPAKRASPPETTVTEPLGPLATARGITLVVARAWVGAVFASMAVLLVLRLVQVALSRP